MVLGFLWFPQSSLCAGLGNLLYQELVAKGGLRADVLTRTLVPALLEKSDKIRRGHTERTGSSAIEAAGMQDRDGVVSCC